MNLTIMVIKKNNLGDVKLHRLYHGVQNLAPVIHYYIMIRKVIIN